MPFLGKSVICLGGCNGGPPRTVHVPDASVGLYVPRAVLYTSEPPLEAEERNEAEWAAAGTRDTEEQTEDVAEHEREGQNLPQGPPPGAE